MRRQLRERDTREIKHDVQASTANGKMKLLPSVFCSLWVQWKYLYLRWKVGDIFLFLCGLFQDYKKWKRIRGNLRLFPACRKRHVFFLVETLLVVSRTRFSFPANGKETWAEGSLYAVQFSELNVFFFCSTKITWMATTSRNRTAISQKEAIESREMLLDTTQWEVFRLSLFLVFGFSLLYIESVSESRLFRAHSRLLLFMKRCALLQTHCWFWGRCQTEFYDARVLIIDNRFCE